MKQRTKEDKLVRYILFYQRLYRTGWKRIANFLYWQLRIIMSVDIPPQVRMGKFLRLPHYGLGVVMHPATVIGDHVTIYQSVTIGARGREWHTVVGNNVLIGAGAKILGSLHVGDNAKIGANAVVLTDVPANATAVGVPASIHATEAAQEELPISD